MEQITEGDYSAISIASSVSIDHVAYLVMRSSIYFSLALDTCSLRMPNQSVN